MPRFGSRKCVSPSMSSSCTGLAPKHIVEQGSGGAGLDDMILSLIEKSCPPVDCKCKEGTPWGACQPDGTQTNVCVPETLPDFGGAPCVSPTRPCRYVLFVVL